MSEARMRYAVFLRGVNVGGVTLINEKLLDIAHAAGFECARALMASGNLLLASDRTAKQIEGDMESALTAACGAVIPCFVRSSEQLLALLHEDDTDPAGFHHYLLFCRGDLLEALSEVYARFPHAQGEALFGHAGSGHADIHWIVQKGNSLSDFGSKVLGRQFRDLLTSRNLRTVRRVAAALMDPDVFAAKGKR